MTTAPTTEELRILLEKTQPGNDRSCDHCGGFGEIFSHHPDCSNDDCVLACGIDDCDGQVTACFCRERFTDAALAALPSLLDQIEVLTKERDAYRDALDPNETKAAYIGEIKFRTIEFDEFGDEHTVTRTLEWDTTKDVMAMIRARARSALAHSEGK